MVEYTGSRENSTSNLERDKALRKLYKFEKTILEANIEGQGC